MRVRAAVLAAPSTPFTIEDLDLAAPGPGEVLVRVRAVGVCHSDWHLVTGDTPHPMPLVPGHEGAGVVEAVGDGVERVRAGDHVALNWAPSCGACFYCRQGRPALCETFHDRIWAGTLLDGTTRLSLDGRPVYHYCALAAFAERTVVPEACCVPIAKTLPFEVAALIGCAVTTGVGAVLNTAKVKRGASVAVFGAGGVGLSVVMGAVAADASSIIALDLQEDKLAVAREFGATDVLRVAPDAAEQVRRLTGGRGADYVFEAVGVPSAQEACLGAARPGGVVVFAGLTPATSTTNIFAAALTRQEKTVMGSYYGSADPARDFPRYARMYRAGRLDLDRLVRRTYRLDEINEAYADLVAGAPGRGVIVM